MIKFDKANGVAVYGNTGEFTFSSPIDEICESIANQLLNREFLSLGDNMVYVEQLQVEKPKVKEEQITVTTLSPIVVYSTLYKYDKQKYTCYFMPGEVDYERLITENLKKKYKAFTGMDHYGENLVIKPLGRIRQSIVYYKDTVVKGCVGKFIIAGDKDLLQMGIDAGFGSKNSQGFGCVKLV